MKIPSNINRNINIENFIVKYEGRQTGLRLLGTELRSLGIDVDATVNGDAHLENPQENSGDESETELQQCMATHLSKSPTSKKENKLKVGVHLGGLKSYDRQFPRELRSAEQFLDLAKYRFAEETLRTLEWIHGGRKSGHRRRQPGDIVLPGLVEVDVTLTATKATIVYLKITDSSHLVKDTAICTETYKYARDEHWVAPRHDTVLVKYDSGAEAHSVGSTMLGRRVARLLCLFLLCLFPVSIFDELELALVQWFECNRAVEEKTGMYLVNKKKEYEVIELAAIERTVHLIPQFGPVGSTRLACCGQPQGLDVYDKVVINNQVNLEVYNLIY